MLNQRLKTRLSYGDLLELYLLKGVEDDKFNAQAKCLGFIREKEPNNEQIVSTNGFFANEFLNDYKEERNQSEIAEKKPKLAESDDANQIFYYVEKRERTKVTLDDSPSKSAPEILKLTPLENDEIYDIESDEPTWQSLTRNSRLWTKLRKIFKQQYVVQEPDIPKIVQSIESGESLVKVPYLQRQRRISQLIVLADYSPHLRTVYDDYYSLNKQLKKYWGRENTYWQSIVDYPGGRVATYKNEKYQEVRWRIPKLDTAILILSDCGCFGPTEAKQQWQNFLKNLTQMGNTVLLLAPASRRDLLTVRLDSVHAFSWDKNFPKLSNAFQLVNISAPPLFEVEVILSYLAFTYRIEAHLLRTVRQSLDFSISVEAKCRQHRDVIDDGEYLYIKKDELPKYRKKFNDLSAEEQDRAINLVRDAHSRLPRSILDYELVTAQALRPDFPVAGVKESLVNLQRISKTFASKGEDYGLKMWAIDFLERQERGGEEVVLAWLTLHKDEIAKNGLEGLTPPRNVSWQEVSRFIDKGDANGTYSIQQCDDALVLHHYKHEIEQNLPFEITRAIFTQDYYEINKKKHTLYHGAKLPLPTEQNSIVINTGTENLTLGTLTKPHWADLIGHNEKGIFIETEHQGKYLRIYYPQWQSKLGKDEYGVFIDLTFKGVLQRFRYVSSGKFLMGSPSDEFARGDNEKQHQVTLTDAFWLADTACTQELWKAVMRDNPSSSKVTVKAPVENVSRDNVQLFIEALNSLIPGLNAQLPTEAQWEYACRSNTKTPSSFGNSIKLSQVNCDKNYPDKYKVGKVRGSTIAVKSLSANAWGFYQMHGNVFEWCQDLYGEYDTSPSINPIGCSQGVQYVLRGGSWIHEGEDARSAYRTMKTSGFKASFIGFRISLGQAISEILE